jgi:hypothetical protein
MDTMTTAPRRWIRSTCLGALAAVIAIAAPVAAASPESARTALRLELADELLARADAESRLAGALLLAEADALSGAPGMNFLRAENAFERLRAGSRDPRVLWIAATACPFAPSVCDAEGARAGLRAHDGDNGAAWLVAAIAALDAGDDAALAQALAGIGASPRFDLRSQSLVHPIHAALRPLTHDARWQAWAAELLQTESARVDGGLAALVLSAEFGLAVAFPDVGRLAGWCVSPAARVAGQRRACERAMAAMAANASTVLEARIGHAAAARLTSDQRRRAAHARGYESLSWLAVAARGAPAREPEAVRAELARLMVAPSELSWLRANVAARGLRELPPSLPATPRVARRD